MKIECRSQNEVDKALETANEQTELHLFGNFNLSLKVSLKIIARESSQPRIEVWGSSQPRIEAWESSQPHIVARGSSQPRIEAWESSQPHIVARGYVSLVLTGKVICKLGKFCHAVLLNFTGKVSGKGSKVKINIDTLKKWLDYYGIPVKKGIAILYKAVSSEYKSGYNFDYKPGSIPVAPDWDNGIQECGKGLHFCASPIQAKYFFEPATKFMACPVALKDMRCPRILDQYPNKIKAKGCCAPCWEVDIAGKKNMKRACCCGAQVEIIALPFRLDDPDGNGDENIVTCEDCHSECEVWEDGMEEEKLI